MKRIILSIMLVFAVALLSCKGADNEPAPKKAAHETPAEPIDQKPAVKEEGAAGFTMEMEPVELDEKKLPKKIIEVPAEIANKWSAVQLEVVELATGKKENYEVKIGDEISVKGTGLKVKVLNFLPNFTMGSGIMTSLDANPENPAANIIVTEGGNQVWEGVIFMMFPDAHPFEHDKYGIYLRNYIPAKSETK